MKWFDLVKEVYGKVRNFAQVAFDRLKLGNIKKLRQAFVTSIRNGESFDQLLKRLQKVTDSEASSAKRIAITESTRVWNSTQYRIAVEEQEETGIQYDKTWICTFHNSRDSHIELHGTKIPLLADFQAHGGPMAFPGDDSRVGPEELINCRCYLIVTRRR